MKKFVKMSLVAALAVAGTTASAQPLAEAIKNVDVSGTMVYRYNDYQEDVNAAGVDSSSKTTNYYKIGLNLKSKVNDDVTANTRFVIGSQNASADFGKLNTQSNGDTNLDVELTNANFAYTGIANTTVIVGKQGLTTPWTVAVDATGNEQTGTGILALTTVGPVTFAGAYFNQTNVGESGDAFSQDTDAGETDAAWGIRQQDMGSKDIYTAGIMGKVGPVALDAWYLDMADVFDTYTLGANTSFDVGAVTLGGDLRYTSLDLDNNDKDNSLLQATITAKVGIFDAKVAYATTDKEGGLIALDTDATTSISAWSVDSNNKADADYWQARLGFQVLPSLNISANYADVQYNKSATDKTDMEEEEYYAQLNYSMSKNLSAYMRYGQYTKDEGSKSANDSTRGRINIQYKF
tara:strand:+ start:89491 stop:90711 length:1221 start_codon:yes stop_codon:yes gene_type:complete